MNINNLKSGLGILLKNRINKVSDKKAFEVWEKFKVVSRNFRKELYAALSERATMTGDRYDSPQSYTPKGDFGLMPKMRTGFLRDTLHVTTQGRPNIKAKKHVFRTYISYEAPYASTLDKRHPKLKGWKTRVRNTLKSRFNNLLVNRSR